MDFVKSTTVVGENIPPELGIVHFLKTGEREKRRRMGGAVGMGSWTARLDAVVASGSQPWSI
jgi:hypothetical protein